jgi:hypothetical protein
MKHIGLKIVLGILWYTITLTPIFYVSPTWLGTIFGIAAMVVSLLSFSIGHIIARLDTPSEDTTS